MRRRFRYDDDESRPARGLLAGIHYLRRDRLLGPMTLAIIILDGAAGAIAVAVPLVALPLPADVDALPLVAAPPPPPLPAVLVAAAPAPPVDDVEPLVAVAVPLVPLATPPVLLAAPPVSTALRIQRRICFSAPMTSAWCVASAKWPAPSMTNKRFVGAETLSK